MGFVVIKSGFKGTVAYIFEIMTGELPRVSSSSNLTFSTLRRSEFMLVIDFISPAYLNRPYELLQQFLQW